MANSSRLPPKESPRKSSGGLTPLTHYLLHSGAAASATFGGSDTVVSPFETDVANATGTATEAGSFRLRRKTGDPHGEPAAAQLAHDSDPRPREKDRSSRPPLPSAAELAAAASPRHPELRPPEFRSAAAADVAVAIGGQRTPTQRVAAGGTLAMNGIGSVPQSSALLEPKSPRRLVAEVSGTFNVSAPDVRSPRRLTAVSDTEVLQAKPAPDPRASTQSDSALAARPHGRRRAATMGDRRSMLAALQETRIMGADLGLSPGRQSSGSALLESSPTVLIDPSDVDWAMPLRDARIVGQAAAPVVGPPAWRRQSAPVVAGRASSDLRDHVMSGSGALSAALFSTSLEDLGAAGDLDGSGEGRGTALRRGSTSEPALSQRGKEQARRNSASDSVFPIDALPEPSLSMPQLPRSPTRSPRPGDPDSSADGAATPAVGVLKGNASPKPSPRRYTLPLKDMSSDSDASLTVPPAPPRRGSSDLLSPGLTRRRGSEPVTPRRGSNSSGDAASQPAMTPRRGSTEPLTPRRSPTITPRRSSLAVEPASTPRASSPALPPATPRAAALAAMFVRETPRRSSHPGEPPTPRGLAPMLPKETAVGPIGARDFRDAPVPLRDLRELGLLDGDPGGGGRDVVELRDPATPGPPAPHPHRPLTASSPGRLGGSPPSKRKVGNYEIIQTIGKGAYGKVKLAVDRRTGVQHAIKVLDKAMLRKMRKLPMPGVKAMDPLKDLQAEIALMKKLDHPNVIRLYEVLDDPETDRMYMVLEWAERGEVLVDGQSLSDEAIWRHFRELVNGIAYLHVQNIVHRDVKPANLLLSADGQLKICDFGVSQALETSQEVISNTKGSPVFFAPESVSRPGFTAKPLDVWAAGITLYYFVYGFPPFQGGNLFELVDSIKNTPLKFDPPCDPMLENLLRAMLQKDPDQRPTIHKIKTHPWVTRNGTCPIAEPVNDQVVDVTQHDISNAFTSLNSLASLLSFSAKMKIRRRSKRDLEASGHRESAVSSSGGSSTPQGQSSDDDEEQISGKQVTWKRSSPTMSRSVYDTADSPINSFLDEPSSSGGLRSRSSSASEAGMPSSSPVKIRTPRSIASDSSATGPRMSRSLSLERPAPHETRPMTRSSTGVTDCTPPASPNRAMSTSSSGSSISDSSPGSAVPRLSRSPSSSGTECSPVSPRPSASSTRNSRSPTSLASSDTGPPPSFSTRSSGEFVRERDRPLGKAVSEPAPAADPKPSFRRSKSMGPVTGGGMSSSTSAPSRPDSAASSDSFGSERRPAARSQSSRVLPVSSDAVPQQQPAGAAANQHAFGAFFSFAQQHASVTRPMPPSPRLESGASAPGVCRSPEKPLVGLSLSRSPDKNRTLTQSGPDWGLRPTSPGGFQVRSSIDWEASLSFASSPPRGLSTQQFRRPSIEGQPPSDWMVEGEVRSSGETRRLTRVALFDTAEDTLVTPRSRSMLPQIGRGTAAVLSDSTDDVFPSLSSSLPWNYDRSHPGEVELERPVWQPQRGRRVSEESSDGSRDE
eukprot:TRINITY_DN2682_c0_g1_i1.p1 TRINITY_DN2682_c0_g1~~TRINITY_DN2682_c0_g1_i1.p1  ORF type:complete len:1512 (-),score=430.95 TRINITY_DN2682_c0_g1_i1:308-4843(-)